MSAPLLTLGRYSLYAPIASGGMATVHLGRLVGPAGFARTVAIKRLHPQFAQDKEFVAMFVDEARVASRIRHPNVVATLDVVAQDNELFLVMDYVEGESLSRLVRATVARADPLQVPIMAAVMSGVLHGLHAAHEARSEQGEPLDIVHRDVSPQNVIVGRDGAPRVFDFGVAKAIGRLQTTREGKIKGKLGYMAPELFEGSRASRQVDIYGAGVVLWEALTGVRLFRGETEADTIGRILRSDIAPPSRSNEAVPPAMEAVVLRALHRDPARRFGTAKEMALAIEEAVQLAVPSKVSVWVEQVAGDALTQRATQVAEIESDSSGRSVTSAPVIAPVAPDAATQTTSLSVSTGPRRMRARRNVWRIGGAAAAIAATCGLALFARQWATAKAPAVDGSPTVAPTPPFVAAPPADSAAASLAPTAPTASTATITATAAPAAPPSHHAPAPARHAAAPTATTRTGLFREP